VPATDVYAAIADPTRRRILDLLATAGRSVTDLAAPFEMSRPAVSQHLRVLREVDLWLRSYQRFWQTKFAALGDYLEATDGQD
jgi:DNA-binding transcriptional ArsR family regulator